MCFIEMRKMYRALIFGMAIILISMSFALGSTKRASKRTVEANLSWFKQNITRRSGHHHQHVAVVENASHPPATVIRAPVVPAVSVSVPAQALQTLHRASTPSAVSTVYAPSVLTVVRRPIVTRFLHAVPPPPPPSTIPVVQHQVAAAPPSVPVYTYLSQLPPPVKPRAVLLHHHHHLHEAKPVALSSIPVVADPAEFNKKYQNMAADDEVIIKERDLAQLLEGKLTQFRGSWEEPIDRYFNRQQDHRERRRAKYLYSSTKYKRSPGSRGYRASQKSHSRQQNFGDSESELQGPNLTQNNYSSRDRDDHLDLSYAAIRADRTLNGRNVVVIIPKK